MENKKGHWQGCHCEARSAEAIQTRIWIASLRSQ
jgi:hypothetical protein